MFINPMVQGWMFLPLVDYHGGGEEAQFEPLIDNIKVNYSCGHIHKTIYIYIYIYIYFFFALAYSRGLGPLR